MQSTGSEAQVTPAGEAIVMNTAVCTQLFQLFAPMYGPHGRPKALVNQQVKLVRGGQSVIKGVPFTHPTSILITRSAGTLCKSVGDGSTTFILVSTEAVRRAYEECCGGAKIGAVIGSLQVALRETVDWIEKEKVQLDQNLLRKLGEGLLRSKIRDHEKLGGVVEAVKGVKDPSMVEIVRMDGEGDPMIVKGLVLDHAGRDSNMPVSLERVCVLVSSMSLEYEKPEDNGELSYRSVFQRERLASTEREFTAERAKVVAKLGEKLKEEGRSLLFVTEKGIDPESLSILAGAGILGLRRAKRRNIERLVVMCGGKIVTEPSQVTEESLGYCDRVRVHSVGENWYTVIEGPALRGVSTVLLRGVSDPEGVEMAVRETVTSIFIAARCRYCVEGGIPFYWKLREHLLEKAKKVHENDAYGHRILAGVCETLVKTLLRNGGVNVSSGLTVLSRGDAVKMKNYSCVESAEVLTRVLSNAVATAVSLLMCDDIIRAGKLIEQEGMKN